MGTLLIVAGVSLALYPFLANICCRYFQAAPEVVPADFWIRVSDEDVPYLLPPEGPAQDYPEELEPAEGTLEIPALDIRVGVGYGVERADLNSRPGFYPESGYPDSGNVCIAGHRTTYGAWFRHLDKLEAGDEIILYYNGKAYLYCVERVFAVDNRDWSVIDPTPEPALTLTTCHPPGRAVERLVVRAYLDDSFVLAEQ